MELSIHDTFAAELISPDTELSDEDFDACVAKNSIALKTPIQFNHPVRVVRILDVFGLCFIYRIHVRNQLTEKQKFCLLPRLGGLIGVYLDDLPGAYFDNVAGLHHTYTCQLYGQAL